MAELWQMPLPQALVIGIAALHGTDHLITHGLQENSI